MRVLLVVAVVWFGLSVATAATWWLLRRLGLIDAVPR